MMQRRLKNIIFILIALVSFQSSASLIDGTKITCIQTADDGSLSVFWESLSDPNGEFISYEVGGSFSTTNYTISNINIDNLTIPVPGLATSDFGFHVVVNATCNGGISVSSDTVSNIFLELNNPSNGVAILQWNKPFPTQKTTYNDYYHIYREFPAGNWTLHDSVPYGTTQYRDTIDICSTQLGYQIKLPTTNCEFTSNKASDVFEDKIVPNIPDIERASIDLNTGNVILTWDENQQKDTYGYVIYFKDENGFFQEIDTVWGISNTNYTHNPTGDGPYSYTVAAFDSCYTNAVPATFQTSAKGEPHTTALLSLTIDNCTRIVSLNWVAYEGFDNVLNYDVLIRENGGAWTVFGQTTNTNFNVPTNELTVYEFAIRANSVNGFSANSNIKDLIGVSSSGLSYSYLSTATVVGELVEIHHKVSLDGGITKVVLQKYDAINDRYETLEEQNVVTEDVVFEDATVEVERQSYKYRTFLINNCGISGDTSNVGNTILLSSFTNDTEGIHYLQWSPYTEFEGRVLEYRLFRGIDGVFDTTPYQTLSADVRYFEDKVYDLDNYSGKICYKVQAIEEVNTYGFEATSMSNIVCSVLEPQVFVPNSFTPGGYNPIFLPRTRLRQVTDYELSIYNRTGQVVFKSTDVNTGWDGKLPNGEVASETVYIYRLSIRDGNGIEVLKNGHVSLLNDF